MSWKYKLHSSKNHNYTVSNVKVITILYASLFFTIKNIMFDQQYMMFENKVMLICALRKIKINFYIESITFATLRH